MKFIIILMAFTLVLPLSLSAEAWKLTSDVNVSLTQSAYSNSWAGTELSSITWAATSNTSAEKQLKSWLHNRNTLKLAFGQTHLQKGNAAGEKYWEKPEKSTDKIDLESLLRFTTNTWVDPFISGRMESQFIDISDPSLTRVVNPLLFTETAGVIRTLVKNDASTFNIRLGAAIREKLDRDVLNASTNEREMLSSTDGGLEMVSEYKHNFAPINAGFNSRLQVYQALFNSKEDELNEDWKSTDMVWENVLTAQLWKMLTANLSFEARYEKEAVHELQWKQVLGLGLSYSLF